MRDENIFAVLMRYLRGKISSVFLLVLTVLIFLLVFYLYEAETDAVLYAGLLSAFSGLIVFSVDFYKFYRKHLKLTEIERNVLILSGELPESNDVLEKDYCAVIEALSAKCAEISNDLMSQRTESVDFYTAWVHQMKTPVAAMQMILQAEDTDEHRQLQAELFRIEQYTDMVLQYFRLDSGASDLVICNYSLDEIIKKAVRKYAPLFVRKRIRLIYEPVENEVVTDEKWFSFILEQILSNAVKYTNSGSVTITCDENGILNISDTGIGIASEDLPRIFEKGFTGYNGRSGRKSTGLGLYLCRKAADKLGCRISVVSEPGKGSTFSVDPGNAQVEIE